jgi:hypothetical protein
MIIHPSSTIYCDLSEEMEEAFKIPDTNAAPGGLDRKMLRI